MRKNPIILFDIDYTLFDTDIFKSSNLTNYRLYNEVPSMLQQLEKIATLGIFSQGEIDFQRKKLHETAIEKYFVPEYVHITLDKETMIHSVLADYHKNKRVFLIDDKPVVLEQVKKALPEVTVIWIERGIYATSQHFSSGFSPDYIVQNLSDIIPFIREQIA
ncbi:MAG: hypothetical protein AAB553_05355 [Patescibacteria group bacterium]